MEAPLRKRFRQDSYAWAEFTRIVRRCLALQQPAESGATIHGHTFEVRTRELFMHGTRFMTYAYFMDNRPITPAVLGDELNRLADQFERRE